MDGYKSLSQGVFMSLPPGFNLSKLRRRKKRKIEVDDDNELWEQAFSKIWPTVEAELKKVSENVYSKVLNNLIKHIEKLSKSKNEPGTIPCELLLTGTNLSDHKLLLDSLTRELNNGITTNVAILWANGSATLKNAIQNLVRQIVYQHEDTSDPEDSDDDEELEEIAKARPAASQLSLTTLAAWYQENKNPIVVIIPDFESFSPVVLSDLIALLCAYESSIPFILVFGVATSPSAVYQVLPRSVMSRLIVQLFTSEPSPTFLNHIVENILLTDVCPFRLTGRTMTFLIDLFLFNSFSVQRFIQGFKYCMMEHFYRKPQMILCCASSELLPNAKQLSSANIENLRRLPSFQKHVEESDIDERKRLLLDDKQMKKFTLRKLGELHKHASDFHITLKCLNILVRDLPGAPLGRHVREIYCRAVSNNIMLEKDYKHALALLGVQSKTELSHKLAAILAILKVDSIVDILSEGENRFSSAISKLEELKKELDECEGSFKGDLVAVLSTELLEPFLAAPTSLPMHEIFYFDDLVAVRRRISGAPRSAIHNALNNPHSYLECECCELSDLESVSATMPDVSIAYKLYLESSKTINLFDWLQSFSSVIESGAGEGQNGDITEQLQARFTRAVSELQFLGFIKPSRAKPDFVTRLTFGNF